MVKGNGKDKAQKAQKIVVEAVIEEVSDGGLDNKVNKQSKTPTKGLCSAKRKKTEAEEQKKGKELNPDFMKKKKLKDRKAVATTVRFLEDNEFVTLQVEDQEDAEFEEGEIMQGLSDQEIPKISDSQKNENSAINLNASAMIVNPANEPEAVRSVQPPNFHEMEIEDFLKNQAECKDAKRKAE